MTQQTQTVDQMVSRAFARVYRAIGEAVNEISNELKSGRITWTTEELAQRLGFTTQKVRLEHHNGRLRATKLGNRLYFTLQMVEEYLDAHDTHGEYRKNWDSTEDSFQQEAGPSQS